MGKFHIKMKKSIFFLTISLLFLFTVNAFSAPDNLGRNVYSIFSENFNGVKIDWYVWQSSNPASLDNAKLYLFSGGGESAPYMYNPNPEYDSPLNSKDGNKYWRIRSSNAGKNGWSGMAVTMVDGSNNARFENMSAYENGTMEFWAKAPAMMPENNTIPNQALEIKVGVTGTGTDRVVSLGQRGFIADNTWRKVVIPLNKATLGQTLNMSAIKNVLYMGFSHLTAFIEIDCVVWKKPTTGGTFTVNIKNIDGDTPADKITWSDSALSNRWYAANQYLELDLDWLQNDNWGIQIYTDNKSADANPKYTGITDPNKGSGLVAVSSTTKMLPMCWRVTDKVLPYDGTGNAQLGDYDQTLSIGFNSGGLYDSGTDNPDKENYYCWFAMKDKDMFGMIPDNPANVVDNGSDYLRVWDRRGFHSAAGDINYWGMNPGSMFEGMIRPRIYLGADFGLALTPETYKTNSIIIELFYE